MLKNRQRNLKAKKGVSLLVALLVMSVVVAIGITVSTVVIFQVKVNSVVFQGHQNYYIAESGIEYGLNVLKEKKSGSLSTALSSIQTVVPFPGGIPTQADLTQSAGLSGGSTVPTELKENTSAYIELYDVDDSLQALTLQTPILCVFGDSTDGNNNEVMEITWIAWSTGLEISNPQKALVSYSDFSNPILCGGSNQGGYSVNLNNFYPAFTPAQLAGFRIRITALKPNGATILGDGDIKNFKVFTDPSTLSTQIQVKSISSNAGQTQALIASLPWSVPLSSFYDFVIFSEKSLSKTLPVSIDQSIKKFGPFPVLAGNNPIPTTPSDPFTGCDTNPCNYYVRLISSSPASAWGSFTVSSGAVSNSVVANLAISSCILRNPYTFSATSGDITFPNPLPGTLFQYELISQVTFKDPSETYCPGS